MSKTKKATTLECEVCGAEESLPKGPEDAHNAKLLNAVCKNADADAAITVASRLMQPLVAWMPAWMWSYPSRYYSPSVPTDW